MRAATLGGGVPIGGPGGVVLGLILPIAFASRDNSLDPGRLSPYVGPSKRLGAALVAATAAGPRGVMAAMALAVLAIYLVVLFNTQVVHHKEYLAKSVQTITRMENVEASRGIITDRSGRTLVTHPSTYSLTFDASLLKPGENQNDAILRLVTLCRDQGVAWEDNLPLSLDGAAHFTVDTLTDMQKSRFFSYLRDLKPTRELLAAYVRQHPELLKPPKEGETALDPAAAQDPELLKQTNSAALTNSLLLNAGVTPAKPFDWYREGK